MFIFISVLCLISFFFKVCMDFLYFYRTPVCADNPFFYKESLFPILIFVTRGYVTHLLHCQALPITFSRQYF